MSQIIYAVPNRFVNYSPTEPVSSTNKGGGVSTKSHRVCEAWDQYYDVVMMEGFDQYPKAHTLVFEPLMIRLARNSEQVIQAYANHDAALKVLYCSEQSILEIPKKIRDVLFKISSVVTTCCDFQADQLVTMGYSSIRLCDPIPPLFFNSDSTKDLSVMGIGLISYQKNSEQMVEIFKQLSKYKVRTVYIGGASLWGSEAPADSRLENELRKYCTEFHHNVAQSQVASVMHGISMGVFNTYHETCSESNQEANAAGVLGFYGGHSLWLERPGIHGLVTAEDYVDSMASKTKGFTELPDADYRLEAESWAQAHCSYKTFIDQWQEVRHA